MAGSPVWTYGTTTVSYDKIKNNANGTWKTPQQIKIQVGNTWVIITK